MLGFYAVLRQVVRQSGGRLVLSRCAECGIFFSSHSCNRGRGDLRCPFGCRREHERREGIRRSRKHNATRKGRETKAANNQRAYYGKRGREVPNTKWRKVPVEPAVTQSEDMSCLDDLGPQDREVAGTLALHVREVMWGGTGDWVSPGWVMELLVQLFRRRGLGGAGRFGYFVGQLRQKPP